MEHNLKTDPKTGFRLLEIPNQATDAVTCLLLARAGSRYETAKISGLSHFIEHMFFKGGKRYLSTQAVSETIDSVGGEFNAFTGKEYAGYYIKVAKTHLEVALDVLSDMMLNATFPESEFEREKQVILEELKMYEDNPMHKAAMAFEELLYGDHPLGWDIGGTQATVKSFTRKNLLELKEKLYTPNNILGVVSGNFDQTELEVLVDQYFPFADEQNQSDWKKFQSFPDKRELKVKKPIEQTNLVIGVPVPGMNHKDKYALQLLSIILGGNMSSRMFLNIREKLGLCYYIYTSAMFFKDTGYLATYAGVDSDRAQLAEDKIIAEYNRIAQDLTQEEIDRAVYFMLGKLTLTLEDSEERANFYGRQLLLENVIETIPEIIAKMKHLQADDIQGVAKKYLKDFRITKVGPTPTA